MASRIPPKTRRTRQFPEPFCWQHGTAVAAILNLTSPKEGDILQLTYDVTPYHMYVSEFQQMISHILIFSMLVLRLFFGGGVCIKLKF